MSENTKQAQGINHFDVLKVMSLRDLRIYFGPDIMQINKVRAGTKVTVGIGGDLVAAIADGQLVGGLFLWDREQFDEIKSELEQAVWRGVKP